MTELSDNSIVKRSPSFKSVENDLQLENNLSTRNTLQSIDGDKDKEIEDGEAQVTDADFNLEIQDLEGDDKISLSKQPLIEKRFARNNRYCWGGMAKWPFWLLVSFVSLCIFLAIFVPIFLYVIMPVISQHIVDHTDLGVQNLNVNTWDTDVNSVENQHYDTYLPMFAQNCQNNSLLEKETFLSSTVADTLPCFFLGTTEGNITKVFELAFKIYLPATGAMTWKQYFASVNMQSCSDYNPKAIQGSLDLSLDGIPGFIKGEIASSYLFLYGENDDINTMEPFARIAIPSFSINEKEGSTRIAKNMNVTVKVFDRLRFLMNNFNLLDFAPLTSGYTVWRQIGDLQLTVDLGAKFHFPIHLDTYTRIGPAYYNYGPFSMYNADAQIQIESPLAFFGCMLLDFLPNIMEKNKNNSSSSAAAITSAAHDVYRRSASCQVDFTIPIELQKDQLLDCFQKIASSLREAVNFDSLLESSQSTSGSKTVLSEIVERVPDAFQEFLKTSDFDVLSSAFFGTNSAPTDIDSDRRRSTSTTTTEAYTTCIVEKEGDCSFASLENKPYLIQPNDDSVDAQCLFGDDYQFTIQPEVGENSTKVLLYYQGGGADWNELLNDFTNTATTSVVAPDLVGVYDKNNNANPFKTWTIITVIYCSGDAHIGNRTQLTTSKIPLTSNRTRHGYDNTMSVLNWITKQSEIAKPEFLAIMGCSAGALGAQVWSAKVQQMLQATSTNTMLFPDSYLGVFPEESYMDLESGTFEVLMDNNGRCYNISKDYNTSSVLSSPVGKVVQQDWDMCNVLLNQFSDFVTVDTITQCQNDHFDISDFFNQQFTILNAPVAFINSKADSVQRVFAAFIEFTVANFAGVLSSTKQGITLTKTPIYKEQDDDVYFEIMSSCQNGELDTHTFYNNLTYTVRDDIFGMYILQLLKEIDQSTEFNTPLNTLINKLIASLVNYFLSGGPHGNEFYWKAASKILDDYTTAQKTWFLVDSEQHCYTCLNNMYSQMAGSDGLLMVDWIQDGINNLLNGNKQIVKTECDVSDNLECPQPTN
eukprot:Pgem_evm1s6663